METWRPRERRYIPKSNASFGSACGVSASGLIGLRLTNDEGVISINMRYQNLDALNGRQPAAYAFLPALKTPSPYNPPEATHKMNKL